MFVMFRLMHKKCTHEENDRDGIRNPMHILEQTDISNAQVGHAYLSLAECVL